MQRNYKQVSPLPVYVLVGPRQSTRANHPAQLPFIYFATEKYVVIDDMQQSQSCKMSPYSRMQILVGCLNLGDGASIGSSARQLAF
jgi:hypothetical protein